MPFDRTGNLLGALSLVVIDRTAEAVSGSTRRSESEAAALSWLRQFNHRPSVDLLGRVLGLSSSGTVRLLDRLGAAGYVSRGAGPDGRTISVSLTAAGRRAAEKVAAARAEVLEHALRSLSDQERQSLERLQSKMLVSLMREPGATRWMCRMCHTGVCRAGPGCPVTNVVRKRQAAASAGASRAGRLTPAHTGEQ
ncbi:MAG TPA: MarR family winged helix-turn-helix transcriptional regulator [Candidatus Dormibacteraeota bacterium]|nr:MarR family winged helix-turn-helix transcriptional regulator [Candidatus Dormibacteraeota bacterium]